MTEELFVAIVVSLFILFLIGVSYFLWTVMRKEEDRPSSYDHTDMWG